VSDRPKGDDQEALEYLSNVDGISEWDAEFLESLSNWTGTWTDKQAACFDRLCDRYMGGH